MKGKTGLILLLRFTTALTGCGGNGQEEKAETESAVTEETADAGETAGGTGNVYEDITGIAPDEIVMTIEDNQIPAEMYFYWVAFNCSALEYQINLYYDYYDQFEELLTEDGDIDWDASFTDEQTISEYALSQADELAGYYAALENLADAYGVSLSEEDLAAIEADRQSMEDDLGGEEAFDEYLTEMGLSLDSFMRITSASSLLDGLIALADDSQSSLYLPPEQYADYATEESEDEDSDTESEKEEILEQYVTGLLNEYVTEHPAVKMDAIASLDAGSFYESYLQRMQEIANEKAIDTLTESE